MGIILTTGRSGSTVVSWVLRQLPGCLSLPEALVNIEAFLRDPGVTSGAELARLLAEPTRTSTVFVRHGLRTPELWPGNLGRATVPPLLMTTLGEAGLADPDAVQRALVAWALDRPPAPLGGHVAAIFSWLCRHSGRSSWVERSGGSLFYAPEVEAMFPDERLVVLLRDPLRTVESMSRHLGFRLVAVRWELRRLLGFDPYLSDAPLHPPAGSLRPPYDSLLPDTFDPSTFASLAIPLEWFALYWSRSVRRALASVESGRSTIFWAEELAARPRTGLDQLVNRLGLPAGDRAWHEVAAASLSRAATGQSPVGRAPRLGRLVRTAFVSAMDLTDPDLRPRHMVVPA